MEQTAEVIDGPQSIVFDQAEARGRDPKGGVTALQVEGRGGDRLPGSEPLACSCPASRLAHSGVVGGPSRLYVSPRGSAIGGKLILQFFFRVRRFLLGALWLGGIGSIVRAFL